MRPDRTSAPASLTNVSQIHRSNAFRIASLRSERHRVYTIVGLIATVIVPVALISASRVTATRIWSVAAIAGLALLLVQGGTFAIARWAQRTDREIPL